MNRYLSEEWFKTETDMLLAAGYYIAGLDGPMYTSLREQRRKWLRPKIERTLSLLETGADDDAVVRAAEELWLAMDDPGRREFLWWCYYKTCFIGRRPFSRVLAKTWLRPKATSLRGWGFPYCRVVEMFDYALPEALMQPEDLAVFNEFPPEVAAYRGVAGITVGQATKGMSWTLDRDQAEWFAKRNRPLGMPMVLQATIRKPNVLAVFNERESEIVVRPGRVSRVTATTLQ